VLLDALVEVITQEPAPPVPAPIPAPTPTRAPALAHHGAGASEYGYEVQYLLDATEGAVGRLRGVLSGLGDSLVIGSADIDAHGRPDAGVVQAWHVHVHVDDIGAAIEAGVEAGHPYRISVTRFADQLAWPAATAAAATVAAATAAAPVGGPARGVVAVAQGPGLAALMLECGAVTVPGTPSTVEIVAAIDATGARQVVVLPNDPDSQAIAAMAAAEAASRGVVVRVVPTRCAVQALAALAVRDADRPFEDDVIAMAEAAGACRYAEVTVAAREALTVAGRCQPGDILALVEGEVNLIGKDLEQTSRDLLDRMLAGGGELVTLVVGADGPSGLGDAVAAHITRRWPFVTVQVFAGGQPHYPLLVGVE
jgi:uncharacterized protein